MTDDEIKYMALKEIGITEEPDFADDSTTEVSKVNERYEPCLSFALGRYLWTFATEDTELTERQTLNGKKYKYKYELPSDLMFLRNQYTDVKHNSVVRDYEKRGQYFLTDEEKVFIEYTKRVSEDDMPFYFIDYFKLHLAKDICLGLTGDDNLEQNISNKETMAFLEAKNIDARQNPPRRFKYSPFTAVRG